MSQSRQTKRVPVNFLVIGLIMFVAFTIMSPGLLPNLLANAVPGAYEGAPCVKVARASNRAFHQSIVGRASTAPIRLEVATSGLPTSADGFLVVYITLINQSLGTVPVVYDANQVVIGDNGSSGLGILFTPQNTLNFNNRADPPSFADTQLLLLGPRQRCVHELRIPAGNVLVDPSITSGTAQLRAFYRNNSPGVTSVPAGTLSTPIFRDQGLWVGYAESPSIVVGSASATS